MKALKSLNLRDALIVTTRSLLNSPLIDEIKKLTGNPMVMRGPSQHTPKEELDELMNRIEGKSVISVGGGSVIDSIKISFPRLHVAIPTTLSGAEHTSVAGYTEGGLKVSVNVKPPDVVILDPWVLSFTPKSLLVTTSFRALDHAIEANYSVKATPFTDALALKGYEYLVDCLENENFGLCQIGSWLSSLSFQYAGRGLSHVFGYVFGPAFGIPHGVTSCISLVQAIKFNGIFKIPNVVESLEGILRKYDITEKLSKYTTLENALKYAKVFADLTNKSENPKKITIEDAENFIKSVY
ncbi:iron-containing alcohol dehydrogenase [Metallosphaera hakonensis]|uniref:iron-containing alcohol dehydrogenase n=1 Tax=Metallosphaera hakonensis TaxID=79601 RepID=UPI0006CFBDDE